MSEQPINAERIERAMRTLAMVYADMPEHAKPLAAIFERLEAELEALRRSQGSTERLRALAEAAKRPAAE